MTRQRGNTKPPGEHTIKKHSGNDGKWKTPQHAAKSVARIRRGTALDIGFEGMWVTCARGSEKKAMAELTSMCIQYGQDMWGLSTLDDPAQPLRTVSEESRSEVGRNNTIAEEDGIEAIIQRELDSMKPSAPATIAHQRERIFTPILSAMECVFFMRTKPPVVPLDLVERICADANQFGGGRLERTCRYINRITPVATMDKATENGIRRVAIQVLMPHFNLSSDVTESVTETGYASDNGRAAVESTLITTPGDGSEPMHNAGNQLGGVTHTDRKAFTYAIRPTIRHHSNFNSEAVIKLVASLIGPRHKVNLKLPDKVILVDIYQLMCGMSVVDGPKYASLKRFNVNEIHKAALALQGA